NENLPAEHPAIQYDKAEVRDRVSRLEQELQSGRVKLEKREGQTGYLPSLLKALQINPDSQALVFSKTSFQAAKISPANPRAIYFADDVSVGFVRGSDLLEIADIDPKQGVIFYSFDGETNPPSFTRRDVCLQCHQSAATSGIPGLMVTSVYADT